MFLDNPIIPAFILATCAFILLALSTFTVPFLDPFYFLQTSFNGGMKFGGWGWCNGALCTDKVFGYGHDPQIVFWLTYTLILIPIGAFLALLAALSLLPSMLTRSVRIYPAPIFTILSFIAAVVSFIGFAFMISLFTVARQRFRDAGADAEYGPVPWMVLGGTVALIISSLHSGCGYICSIRMCDCCTRRRSRGATYAV